MAIDPNGDLLAFLYPAVSYEEGVLFFPPSPFSLPDSGDNRSVQAAPSAPVEDTPPDYYGSIDINPWFAIYSLGMSLPILGDIL
ncbi:hypothetical protein HEQ62_03555 [Haematospirillum jordaniae]|uniref:Uncharacterized protein n=1 Tax=Haematospirillum jordaniae TaxID=1549855 RepID=A0A143DDJ7_9PROT|nr:hypothetical protein [Haematospirillum jordaniae]AMW34669.1 hypothetical protein AY555_05165 [Haematospirillum jordaniae]NKD44798.1 hypothetical protein [Haematospirillum jordaniae]NKD56988.1 hypothetical protein [Haematospirillum jordaniae]NKD58856.1 hypothetical protein [Haematospirillum jordaniae]NKD66913.1 hypothetical protein [Haematospirillum jordaniae]